MSDTSMREVLQELVDALDGIELSIRWSARGDRLQEAWLVAKSLLEQSEK